MLSNHPKFFITATDTEIGKTTVTMSLLKAFQAQNRPANGLKWLATDGQITGQGLQNDDALALANQSTDRLTYKQTNPFCYPEPIAPHLAAQQAGQQITIEQLNQPFFSPYPKAYYLIEGIGGLLVPLNNQHTLLDWLVQLSCPVITVVGIKLGCLNHALMTDRCLEQAGIKQRYWIANLLDPDAAYIDEQIETLKVHCQASYLATLPYKSEHLINFNDDFWQKFPAL